jgi:hypothetical protein
VQTSAHRHFQQADALRESPEGAIACHPGRGASSRRFDGLPNMPLSPIPAGLARCRYPADMHLRFRRSRSARACRPNDETR